MDPIQKTRPENNLYRLRPIAGILLIIGGGLLFIDRYLKTGWITLLVLPGVGLIIFLYGIRLTHRGLITAGSISTGLGLGLAFALNPGVSHPIFLYQTGYLLSFFGLGWLLVVLSTGWFVKKTAWWALLPGGILSAVGACIFLTPFLWTDIALFSAIGTAIPMLVWGTTRRLFGLIIPGCLIIAAGPGVYFAWGVTQAPNGLAKTGMMLVWFSGGWLLITIFSRVLNNLYAWWPLIPGGIIGTVGFGLYIGGDPGNALGFISNTGSIGLIIFGLYLLLLRKGIHQ